MTRLSGQTVSWLSVIVAGAVALLLASTFNVTVIEAQTAAALATPPSASASSAATSGASTNSLSRGTAPVTLARALRALQRGDTLRQEDFTLVDTVVAWLWTTVLPDTAVPKAGWVTRRSIAVGEVLRAPAVVPPAVITAGAAVKVLWQEGSLRLVVTGIATNTAALGAPVGVRIDKNRRLNGFAVGLNTVRLR